LSRTRRKKALSLKVLLENLLRYEDGRTVTARGHPGGGRLADDNRDIKAVACTRSPSARPAC
jgi:hypothetical protein